jgi:hypothetical protein
MTTPKFLILRTPRDGWLWSSFSTIAEKPVKDIREKRFRRLVDPQLIFVEKN